MPRTKLPTGNTITDWQDWWLEVQCCRKAQLPLRKAVQEGSGFLHLSQFASRLRCRSCGERPHTADLVDAPSWPPQYDQQRVPVSGRQ